MFRSRRAGPHRDAPRGALSPIAVRCAFVKFARLAAPFAVAASLAVSTPASAQFSGDAPTERISAFPCIVCPAGGDLLGILPRGQGRAVKSFEAFKEFCVSDYRYRNGELQVRLSNLDLRVTGKLKVNGSDFTVNERAILPQGDPI